MIMMRMPWSRRKLAKKAKLSKPRKNLGVFTWFDFLAQFKFLVKTNNIWYESNKVLISTHLPKSLLG